MNVRIFYTPNTPADRDIDYLCRRLGELNITPEKVDADSREATAICELYDIVQRPAVLVTDGDGGVVQEWQGELPTAEAVSGYYRTG
jgi:hypothetical protein